jgi:hypothetical protein
MKYLVIVNNYYICTNKILYFFYLKSDLDYIIKNKVSKEHLENYFKYLFTQANDFINKYEEKTK